MKSVRLLNELGCQKFASWLSDPSGDTPRDMLFDPAYSDFVDTEYPIDPDKKFETTFDIGYYLFNDVFGRSNDRFGIRSMNGMWAWISLAFVESLLTRRGKSKPRPLALPHYIDAGPRLSYRLIVRTAWELYLLHGDACRVALSSKASPWGEMPEQMTGATQEQFSHHAFWAVANHLYIDDGGSVKRGAASKRPKSARSNPRSEAGKGSVRRLATTMKQFERTYNTREMSIGNLLGVLPGEFKKWQSEPVAMVMA